MLEVLYDTGTGAVRAWCGDPDQHGNYESKAGQAVVILSIDVADIPRGRDYMVDLDTETVIPATPHVPPPDYKQEWKDAKTTADKVKVLGRKAALEV